MWLTLAATICSSTMTHVQGDVVAAGGDYVDVAFDVPAGTSEIRIAHSDGSITDILDWGVWSPDGFRGWGGGLTEDAVIGVDQSSRGYLPGPITPGTWTLVVGKAQLDADGGHYAIDLTCSADPTLPVLPRAPFNPVVLQQGRQWYRGDFHVHSEQSGDATATFDQIVALARQQRLDFVNLSDHNTVSQHALQAAYLQTHPELLLLRGDEITTYAGHGNAVGLHDYVDHRIGYRGRTIGGMLDDVAAQDAIFLVNHPRLAVGANCIGCAWRHADTDWSKVSGIEIITGNWSIGVNGFVPQVLAMWDGLLDQGHRIAAIGGSDDHNAGRSTDPTASPIGSPTTRVLADNLGEAAIVDAIRHGRTIVKMRGPDDPMVELTLGGEGVSDVLHDAGGPADLEIHVTGGTGMFAQVFRDGVKVHQADVTSDDAVLRYTDSTVGEHRFRIELVDDGNQRIVVTSHLYAMISEDQSCGCGGGVGGAGLGVGALALALRRRRRH